jgi:hypothetical protein
MRNHTLSVVSDAGLEGSGKGNQAIARLNMTGENSVAHRAFLLQRSGGDGMKLLNTRGVWVSLMALYGFDPLNCVFSERKTAGQRLTHILAFLINSTEAGTLLRGNKGRDSNTVKQRLAVAMRAYREQAGPDCTVDLGASDSDGEQETLSVSSEDYEASSRVDATRQQPRSKPTNDPLCGWTAGALAVQPMSIFDFLVLDICLAYPFLGLAKKIEGMTEDIVASAEFFWGVLLEEAGKMVDFAKFKLQSGLSTWIPESLRLSKPFVHNEAINFVLEKLIHVLGGRFVSQDGMYTTGAE